LHALERVFNNRQACQMALLKAKSVEMAFLGSWYFIFN
jgi:hypothetical protein